jgi:hypothetical protein
MLKGDESGDRGCERGNIFHELTCGKLCGNAVERDVGELIRVRLRASSPSM